MKSNEDILILKKIKVLDSITLHMKSVVEDICKDFNGVKLEFLYRGFSKDKYNCDGYDFDENSLEDMVQWVKEDGFPLTDCEVGFGLEIYVEKVSGLGKYYDYLEKGSLCFKYSKLLLKKLKNRYIIRDVEYDSKKDCMWMSIEFNVKEHFEKLNKISKKINS